MRKARGMQQYLDLMFTSPPRTFVGLSRTFETQETGELIMDANHNRYVDPRGIADNRSRQQHVADLLAPFRNATEQPRQK